MEKADIELIPGFSVIEHSLSSTTIKVPSGFTLRIKRIGPYMFDGIMKDDIEDPGPFKIKVMLLEKIQPPGVEQEIIYEPPRDEANRIQEPDKEQYEKAWMYFQQWKMHELMRNNIIIRRGSARFDFALINCVEVIDGPYTVADTEWFGRIEDRVSPVKSFGDRLLIFFKTQVLTSQNIKEVLQKLLFAEEVSIEGLMKAFDSFRSEMARGTTV